MQVFFADAAPRIGNVDNDVFAGHDFLGTDVLSRGNPLKPRANGKGSAVGHRIARIDRQVDEHLIELRFVHADKAQIPPVIDLNDGLCPQQAAQHELKLCKNIGYIQVFRAQRLFARIRQQLTDQTCRASRAVLDVFKLRKVGVGRGVRLQQKLCRTDNRG